MISLCLYKKVMTGFRVSIRKLRHRLRSFVSVLQHVLNVGLLDVIEAVVLMNSRVSRYTIPLLGPINMQKLHSRCRTWVILVI